MQENPNGNYQNPGTRPLSNQIPVNNYQPLPQEVHRENFAGQVSPVQFQVPNHTNGNKLSGMIKKKSLLKSTFFPWILFAVTAGLLIIATGLAFVSRQEYTRISNNTTATIELAEKQAKIEQADADRIDYQRKIDQDYTIYEASNELGSFTFEMPKNWSRYQNQDSLVSMVMHNDVIKSGATRYALRIQLLNEKYLDKAKDLDRKYAGGKDYQAKNGIPARSYVGTIDNEGNLGQMTIFQNRDKTLLIQTDFTGITRYQEVYNYVVASVNINK